MNLSKWDSQHWIIIGLLGGGFAALLGATSSWQEVLTTKFIAAVLTMGSSTLVAMFTDKPGAKEELLEAKYGFMRSVQPPGPKPPITTE